MKAFRLYRSTLKVFTPLKISSYDAINSFINEVTFNQESPTPEHEPKCQPVALIHVTSNVEVKGVFTPNKPIINQKYQDI